MHKTIKSNEIINTLSQQVRSLGLYNSYPQFHRQGLSLVLD